MNKKSEEIPKKHKKQAKDKQYKKLEARINNIEKERGNFSKKFLLSKMNVIIQAVIGVGILLTFIVTLCSRNDQADFYSRSLEPVIYIEPLQGIMVKSDFVRIAYLMENLGQTPAYEIQRYSTLTNSINYPINIFRQKIKGEKKKEKRENFEKKIYLPSGKKYYGESSQIKIHHYDSEGNKLPTKTPQLKMYFIEALSNNQIFLHFYIRYIDNHNKKNYLKSTFKLIDFEKPNKIEDTTEVLKCNWMPVFAAEEPL